MEIFPSTRLNVEAGRDANFHCRVSGDPYARVSWSRVGGALPYGASDQNGRLSITNVQPSHSGIYVCAAVSGYQTKEEQVQLIVDPGKCATTNAKNSRCFRYVEYVNNCALSSG